MSNENTSIHDFDFDLICEYFSTLERQGPGSDEETKKPLSFIENLNDDSKIADIGAGTAAQTMVLAQNTPGKIKAIDLFPLFVNKLNQNAGKNNLNTKLVEC